jgi:DnaJ-class molecular chaperone
MALIDIILNPEEHNYHECEKCNGTGGKITNDKNKVCVDICSFCEGLGVIPNKIIEMIT